MPATLRKWSKSPITWGEINKYAEEGTLDQILNIWDEITFTDKAGAERTAVVAKITEKGAFFAMKDIHDVRAMYRRPPESPVSWAESDARQTLNVDDFGLLPEDLAKVITPRRIVQKVKGKEYVTDDKLWYFSATELFGKSVGKKTCDSPDEEQLPIFLTEADRVKNYDGETWWYNTRSPLSTSTTTFCIVGYYGNAYSNGATTAIGASFGFLIGSQIK